MASKDRSDDDVFDKVAPEPEPEPEPEPAVAAAEPSPPPIYVSEPATAGKRKNGADFIKKALVGIVKIFKSLGERLVMWSMVLMFVFGGLGMGCGLFSVLFPITNNLIYESNYPLWLGFTIAAGVFVAAAFVFAIIYAVEDHESRSYCDPDDYKGELISGGAALGVGVIVMFACGFTHTMFAGGIAIASAAVAGVIAAMIVMLVNDCDYPEGFGFAIAACALSIILGGITYTVVEQPDRHYAVTDGICYIVREDNTLTVFAEDLNIEELVIPSEIDGYRVTSVARPKTVKHNGVLKRVTIPDSVLFIEDEAFKDCTGLESIVIPNSVLTVGENAFYGCRALSSVTLPESLRILGDGAFENCISLPSVTIPSNIVSTPSRAFKGCAKLVSVTVGSKNVGKEAFANCSALTDVTLSDSVETVGARAFASDIILKDIYIPKSVTAIASDAFERCISLTVYVGHFTEPPEVAVALDGFEVYRNMTREDYELETGKLEAEPPYETVKGNGEVVYGA